MMNREKIEALLEGTTPGPWPAKMTADGKRIVIGDGLVEGPGGYEVAEVYSDDCVHEEAWANAHLIAAAPDLYAALERTLNFIANTESEMGETLPCGDVARAALAKARGEA